MIVTKEAVYFYQQTDSYLKQARAALTVTEDWFCINRAASNVSQAAEFVLKAALYSNSIKPSSTHNHRLLVKECRQGRIRVDSELADAAPLLYLWESSLRYEFSDNVSKDDVVECIDIVSRAYTRAWLEYRPMAAKELRAIAPSALADMDDQTLVMECWKILDMRVEKLPSE